MDKHSEAKRIATVAGPVGELLVVARRGDLLVDKQVLGELDSLSDVHARDSEYTSTVDGRIVRAYFSLQLRIEKLVGRFQLVRTDKRAVVIADGTDGVEQRKYCVLPLRIAEPWLARAPRLRIDDLREHQDRFDGL